MLKNKVFLVSGGTGSFGRTLIEYLLATEIEGIICFSRDESKQHDLRNLVADPRLTFVLGDIRDPITVRKALRGVDYVFHAAALKHVPISEVNPWEFVRTNIAGSHNLLNSLQDSEVKKAIFLSTDKAVYPVNAMGMSKALMEKLVRSTNYSGNFTSCITRYGNVIGSRGSVIPEFIRALHLGEIVKITDPNMTRFLMSLSESVDLVMHALGVGDDGDLFVQKSPSATVETILGALCKILEVRNPSVQIIGPRPGEKIHETLLNSEEKTYASVHDNYFRVPSVVKRIETLGTNSREEFDYTSNSETLLNVNQVEEIFLANSELRPLLLR